MPPKAGGRGGGRGRGRGRGGASAARSSAAQPELLTEAATAGDDADSKLVTQLEASAAGQQNVAATVRPQGTTAATAVPVSSASPQTTLDSLTQPQAQRLDDLKSDMSASRSTSPTARRGASTRGRKPPVAKPTFTGRRSRQDREALLKAASDREKERLAEREAEEKLKKRDTHQNKRNQRGNDRGRGGYSGAVSGPFSLGNVAREKRRDDRITVAGSRAARVKREDWDGESGPSGVKSSRGSNPAIKKEDGGYISSDDDDDDAHVPRKDIDLIEISSDEDGPLPHQERGQHSHGHSMLLPVRIGRREHQERVIGINTEASSAASAKILEHAEATGTEIKIEPGESAPRKGKGKAKDVEITGVRKPYKGMWQDNEDAEPQVKAEPVSDDEVMAGAMPIGMSDAPTRESLRGPIPSPEVGKKGKKLKARGKAAIEPVLQTDEERAEYERLKANLRAVRAELGPEEEPSMDPSGDASMKDPNEPKRTVRDNNAYLFHFPPRMPEARNSEVKKEPTETVPSAPVPALVTNGSAQKPIKAEDDKSSKKKQTLQGLLVAPGIAGKLRVHQSGRTSFSWGSESFELTPGQPPEYLQEVLDVMAIPEHMRVVHEDGGEATSFGRVKGKFVVAPDWQAMLR